MMRNGLCALILLLASAGFLQADLFLFQVTLDGSQEVPPNASTATGFATVTFDDVTGEMIINGTFGGLTGGPATLAHVHGFAPPGISAPPVINLMVDAATSGTFSGMGTIAAGNIGDVLAGLTYINIHNNVFPNGEIRGQLTNPIVIPEPASLAGLALGAGLVALRRRRPVR